MKKDNNKPLNNNINKSFNIKKLLDDYLYTDSPELNLESFEISYIILKDFMIKYNFNSIELFEKEYEMKKKEISSSISTYSSATILPMGTVMMMTIVISIIITHHNNHRLHH